MNNACHSEFRNGHYWPELLNLDKNWPETFGTFLAISVINEF